MAWMHMIGKKFTWQSAFSKCFIGNNVKKNQIEIKLTDHI